MIFSLNFRVKLSYLLNPLQMSVNNIVHIPSFVEDTETLFDKMKRRINWQKVNYFKRHVAHYDGSIKQLNKVMKQVALTFSRNIQGVFLNYYEDGLEYAPYHADKYNCDTVLLSLGTQRTLRYKHNETKTNTDFVLKDGDLLYVPDELNNNHKHSLLKTTKVSEPRISILVFLE
jgi:alkylated DNA repair dioxygenase AlkB